MIERLFLTVLSVSLWSCGFIILLRLLLPLLRQRYNAWWRCLVWVLLTIRLLVPFTLQIAPVPLSAAAVLSAGSAGEDLKDEGLQGETRFLVVPPEAEQEARLTGAGDEARLENHRTGVPQWPEISAAAASRNLFLAVPAAAYIWLCGALIFFLIQSVFYLRFSRSVRRLRIPASDPVRECWNRICSDVSVQRTPSLYVCRAVETPVIVGAFRPALLLPHEDYSEAELNCIFRHELVHIRRGDLWYKLAILLANGIHWFNPAVYLMAAEAGKDIEMACDEEAVQGFGKAERECYGSSLIRALPVKRRMDLMMTTNFGSAKETMKMRLGAIYDGRQRSRGWLGLCLMMGMIVMLGTALPLPAVAAQEDSLKMVTELPLKRLPHLFQADDGSVNRLQCGPYALLAGTEYTLTVSWQEGGDAVLNCIGIGEDAQQNGISSQYTVTSGKPLQFTVAEDGYYFTEIPKGVVRTGIRYELKQSVVVAGSVVINFVEMLYNDDGSPYLHDSITNNSGGDIKEYKRGMMAFDKDGNPLQMRWNPFSDAPRSHYFLYDWGTEDIRNGTVHEVSGGWSMDDAEEPVNDTEAIAYALYCFKEITFTDGTVWVNPDYRKWLDTYQDKKVNPELLKEYYPYSVSVIE